MSRWTQSEAIALCAEVEKLVPACGCHVALTGGCLYKEGERKDLDLLFYRIRQIPVIEMDMLWQELATIGIVKVSGHGWVYKALYNGKGIDCFFPEETGGEYTDEEREAAAEGRAEMRARKEARRIELV